MMRLEVSPPPGSSEVDAETLEFLARTFRLTIELPPADGGWALLRLKSGRRMHAWVPGVES